MIETGSFKNAFKYIYFLSLEVAINSNNYRIHTNTHIHTQTSDLCQCTGRKVRYLIYLAFRLKEVLLEFEIVKEVSQWSNKQT